MKTAPETLNKIIGKSDSELSKLMRRAHALEKLDSLFQTLLPQNLQHRCKIANIRNKQLIILTESAAWATRIRYEQANIIRQLQAHSDYAFIKSAVVKIAPSERPQPEHHRPMSPLSDQARVSIRQLADILDDDDLKASVARLAKTVEHNN